MSLSERGFPDELKPQCFWWLLRHGIAAPFSENQLVQGFADTRAVFICCILYLGGLDRNPPLKGGKPERKDI
jgi:hypothetical protein